MTGAKAVESRSEIRHAIERFQLSTSQISSSEIASIVGRVGIDSWHPCPLLEVVALAALRMPGNPDAGQMRGQLVAADVAVLRQLRKWGRFGGW